MNEIFFKATTPDDRTVVEVQQRPDESFHCTVILDGRDILAALDTDDPQRMAVWTKRQMQEAMRRCPAVTTTRSSRDNAAPTE